MAWYMLKGNLDEFVQKIELMRNLGYAELPPHYEEAALVYIYEKRKPLNLSGYRANPQKQRQFEEFTRILDSNDGNKQAASKELLKKFRNTYFFYYMYERSGPDK
jgi:hypothetical protein